jgi:hypothetical protein
LASPHPYGKEPFPVTSVKVPSGAFDLAQSAIFLLIPTV